MKKAITLYLSLAVLCIAASCSSGGDDDSPGPTPPPPAENNNPTAVSQLIYPSSDLLCIESMIIFEWGAASDVDGDPISYILVVAEDRNFTNIVEQRTVSTTSLSITLQPGVAYYWKVTAIDNQGGESDSSATFAFFTEGVGISNHAPFSAALNAPDDEGFVSEGSVNLNWTGSDSDSGDVLTYDLFFGELDPAELIETDLSEDNYDVTVISGKTYYWKVDTTDDSGLKTIGQTWMFTVN